jgi:hypothetical protein
MEFFFFSYAPQNETVVMFYFPIYNNYKADNGILEQNF